MSSVQSNVPAMLWAEWGQEEGVIFRRPDITVIEYNFQSILNITVEVTVNIR